MDAKSFLASKTFWTNIIALGATLLGAQHVVIDPDTQATLVAGVMALVNIALRFVTKGPVNITGANPIVFLALGISLAFSACTSTTPPVAVQPADAVAVASAAPPSDPLARLRQFTKDDLTGALAIATAHEDKPAMQCFGYLPTLLDALPAGATLDQAPGLATIFERLRVGLKGAGNAVIEDINLNCAALFVDSQVTLAKLGIIAAGTASTGGALAPFAGALPTILRSLPVPLQ